MSEPLLQNLDQLEAALVRRGLDPARHAELLHLIRDYFHHYARLERKLLGNVWIVFPRHLLGVDLKGDPLLDGETLAVRERTRLDLGSAEAGDVMRLLDHEGLKVFRPPFPPESPLEGIFLFDREVGPGLVANGNLPSSDVDFTFARLYAHYLFDNDPYRIQLVLRGGGASPGELRAQAFAAAFLIPAEGLGVWFKAAGRDPGTPVDVATVTGLAAYFEVGYRALLTRLLTLRLIEADAIVPMLSALEAAPFPGGDREEGMIGERFVRLALEARARGILDLRTMAQYLETDLGTARRLAGRFRLRGEDGGGDAPRPKGTDRGKRNRP